MQVDLRPVERAVALVDVVLDPAPLERRAQRALGEVPLLVGAELLLGPRRELEARLHSEQVVEVGGKIEAREDLVLDLVRADEDVRVVLRDVLHAQEPVQGSAQLVTVQGRRLGEAQRQVLVAAKPRAEEQHVPRAVHRLQGEPAVVLRMRAHPEDVLLVVLEVPRGLVGLFVVDQRGLHFLVAAPCVLAPAQVFERVPDHHPLRMPERRARRVLREVKQVELNAELAMVTRASLLEPLEVRIQVRLRVERRPIDAGELGVLLVAAPVRPGEAGQLERLDRLRVLQMRAAAKVGEITLGIQRDVALRGVD